ncbi:hypothetical protein BH23ACT10_BH23ACT10_18310 [soil metagenome]
MTAAPATELGAWARADGFIGVVARTADGQVTLFEPGQRRQHTVAATAVERIPSAAVRVTVAVDLPVPHGVDESDLRRWVAMLTDPVLRARAAEALAAADLDDGVTLPEVTVTAVTIADGALHCLCGASTPATDGTPGTATCPQCGRQLAPPTPA